MIKRHLCVDDRGVTDSMLLSVDSLDSLLLLPLGGESDDGVDDLLLGGDHDHDGVNKVNCDVNDCENSDESLDS